jgi:serine/threonine-protein kinase
MTEGPITPGVLAAVTESIGDVPQTLLRDSDPGPLVLPGSSEMPPPDHTRAGRLQLLGEIARGGMGAVLKGRDNDIGRDLAVKVLLDSHRDHPELIRRFIEEAQIGGQLQHPGIVPIYELGTFGDKRPYFAMKLVKGRTLASLLDERDEPSRDLPRFLSIFEAICQTMAYAHARGVIHRDLKPSNVMVGSFGEVQVMDWGLAKVLPQGGAVDDASAGKTKNEDTVIATARSGGFDGDSDLSRAGSVMGTPAYMAPEQARGETDRLDERTDVFALGSILCEILTGLPAFTGRSSGEIQRKAARGDLKESLARLEAATVDPDLVALARDCLGSESEDRPRHAGIIADRVQAHRMSVEERLRQTEIARAEENARAQEAAKRARVEQDRLRLRVALAGALLGLFALGGGGLFRISQIRAEQQAAVDREVNQAISEANVLLGAAKAAPTGDLSKWAAVEAAVKQAQARLKIGDASAGIKDQVSRLQVALEKEHAAAVHRAEELERDRKLVERLERIRLMRFEQGDKWDQKQTIAEYSAVFREFGVDIDSLDSAEAARRIRDRSNPLELAFFIDDWALVHRAVDSSGAQGDEKPSLKLLAVARATDPDPWRNELRLQIRAADPVPADLGTINNPIVMGRTEADDKALNALRRLARDSAALDTQPSRSLLFLAQLLTAQDDTVEAENVLRNGTEITSRFHVGCGTAR